jgi:hypothetical protein
MKKIAIEEHFLLPELTTTWTHPRRGPRDE